ncbi:MAG: tRNA (guanine(46)-N(7))-methyltransferase TrmB [Waddliaceae bacterium]|jgi:tRNA (guanine-N7-)-methyltransferase|nr:tRNA (guanine(46)-N(7))-methyltransferase TrmB [Waddliaceae bacterium]MBT3578989.1 tRNA (guanine(46)-N(7))-methyltransferase TrmB [Waddliaceae bacterium]MBT4444661.1 tRNA (guanine(46)-N(7))-methyltransferase TrmB [Waddliaceae bacterium]MBT6929186.1 tRNA (guanine(46)-N(7))-methyltransferase TrmB [Waddliaceae bacterium]MBT7265160.1 tRNA (guanine(46)-N(7))-methyltransferase TrmB [Waddliaceae bacterium]
MKPKDLPAPYSWKERRLLLKDKILYVPEYYDYTGYSFPSWDDDAVFGNKKPVYIEYCSGNGLWILDRAAENPDINWVAVEKRFDRVRKIWAKRESRQLDNVFIVCGEAQPFAHHYVDTDTVDAIYVNFPDPWPKDRHAKHRLIQKPFVNDCVQSLKTDASFILVTDDTQYCSQMIDVLGSNKALSPEYPEPYYIKDKKDYGDSFFYDLWKGKGRDIHYIKYIKR